MGGFSKATGGNTEHWAAECWALARSITSSKASGRRLGLVFFFSFFHSYYPYHLPGADWCLDIGSEGFGSRSVRGTLRIGVLGASMWSVCLSVLVVSSR